MGTTSSKPTKSRTKTTKSSTKSRIKSRTKPTKKRVSSSSSSKSRPIKKTPKLSKKKSEIRESGKNVVCVGKNTKGKACSSANCTACCPHMATIGDRYMATTQSHILQFNGKKYKVFTCCKACFDQMQIYAKTNPRQFNKLYIYKILPNGNLVLQHRFTHKPVQIAKLMK